MTRSEVRTSKEVARHEAKIKKARAAGLIAYSSLRNSSFGWGVLVGAEA